MKHSEVLNHNRLRKRIDTEAAEVAARAERRLRRLHPRAFPAGPIPLHIRLPVAHGSLLTVRPSLLHFREFNKDGAPLKPLSAAQKRYLERIITRRPTMFARTHRIRKAALTAVEAAKAKTSPKSVNDGRLPHKLKGATVESRAYTIARSRDATSATAQTAPEDISSFFGSSASSAATSFEALLESTDPFSAKSTPPAVRAGVVTFDDDATITVIPPSLPRKMGTHCKPREMPTMEPRKRPRRETSPFECNEFAATASGRTHTQLPRQISHRRRGLEDEFASAGASGVKPKNHRPGKRERLAMGGSDAIGQGGCGREKCWRGRGKQGDLKRGSHVGAEGVSTASGPVKPDKVPKGQGFFFLPHELL